METSKPQRWALNLLFGLLAAALLALGGRTAYLQIVRGEELTALARRQQRRVVVLPARPGNIYAHTAGGLVLLAGSRQVPGCYADPALLEDAELPEVARKVAAAVGVPWRPLYERMLRRRGRRFVYLLREISPEQAKAIRRLGLRAVGVTSQWRREYPNGALAAHVLGFRRIDGQPGAGVELQGQRWLGARDGVKVMRSDAARRGSYVRVQRYRPPRDGRHVVLTLDAVIQGFLEQAMHSAVERFRPAAAMGVVMDPRTGAVLAMASFPTFDPNRYGQARPEQRRNRVITDPFEPGSTFKPFVAVGAVQMQQVSLETEIFCHNGLYRAVRGGTIRDFPGVRLGTIPLSEVVIRSSNIGMAKLGEILGNARLYRIASAFGFGRRTGVDLPGEDPGRLLPVRRWTSYATRRVPFGQGPIMVTTLQLATAFSAIANGGVLLRPRVIDRVFDPDGTLVYASRPRRVRRVLDAATSRRFIDEVLAQVVQRGTGKRCRLGRWRVFGKTGTAQIGGPEGYEERAYTATFMGGAPASRPAVVCVISLYRPDYARGHTGGSVAAPVVRGVLARTLEYLQVPPDRYPLVAGAEPARR